MLEEAWELVEYEALMSETANVHRLTLQETDEFVSQMNTMKGAMVMVVTCMDDLFVLQDDFTTGARPR